ncbi:hypothetical protein BDF19DRAFT_315628 [Syncephalis fuscata]|nr:hypothetical protein BDF19DRAFT_315628 [Syncephalis fuscata]
MATSLPVSTSNTLATSSFSLSSKLNNDTFMNGHDDSQIVYDKRQQRLIKNRAAALMSRKRKREHLASLEQQAEDLKLENDELRIKLTEKDARIYAVEEERDEAQRQLAELQATLNSLKEEWEREQTRKRLQSITVASSACSELDDDDNERHIDDDVCAMNIEKEDGMRLYRECGTSNETRIIKSTSTAGMVFMAIIFSFALLSLPVARITLPLGAGTGNSNEGPAIHTRPVFSQMPPLNTPLPSNELHQQQQKQSTSKLRHADSDDEDDEDKDSGNQKKTTKETDNDVEMIMSVVKSSVSNQESQQHSMKAATVIAAITDSTVSSMANTRSIAMTRRRQPRRHMRRRSSTSSTSTSTISITDIREPNSLSSVSSLNVAKSAPSPSSTTTTTTTSTTNLSPLSQSRIAHDLYNWLIQQGPSMNQATSTVASNKDIAGLSTHRGAAHSDNNKNNDTYDESSRHHHHRRRRRSSQAHFLCDNLQQVMPFVSLPATAGAWQPIEEDQLPSDEIGQKLNAFTCISPGKNGARPRISFLSPIENHCLSIHNQDDHRLSMTSSNKVNSLVATTSSTSTSTLSPPPPPQQQETETKTTFIHDGPTVDNSYNNIHDYINRNNGDNTKHTDNTMEEETDDIVSSDLQRYLRIDVEVLSSHLVEGLP